MVTVSSAKRVRRPKASDSLSTTLASGALARVAIHLGARPEEAQHFRALQRRTGLPVRSLQRELERLQRLGVVVRRRVGRTVRFPLREERSHSRRPMTMLLPCG